MDNNKDYLRKRKRNFNNIKNNNNKFSVKFNISPARGDCTRKYFRNTFETYSELRNYRKFLMTFKY